MTVAVDAPAHRSRDNRIGSRRWPAITRGGFSKDSIQIALTVLGREGFSQAEIDVMTKHNPARFLGLK